MTIILLKSVRDVYRMAGRYIVHTRCEHSFKFQGSGSCSYEAVTLIEKTITTKEKKSDSLLDKSNFPAIVSEEASIAIETEQDASVHTTSGEKSTHNSSELQEEIGSGATRHTASSEKDHGWSQVLDGEGTEPALGESIPKKKGFLMNQISLEEASRTLRTIHLIDSKADAVLKPWKRLTESPSNRFVLLYSSVLWTSWIILVLGHDYFIKYYRNSAQISIKIVDKEYSASVLDNSQNSNLDIPGELSMNELEVPFVLENGNSVEKAEACTKEHNDICNMLRKKHDEAKEILVRATVNNNKLLMLKHPLYEEKISFKPVVDFLSFC
ncbi:hypothetical protein M9H77_26071 [Catharanthus roseus]|uniref:Uncharacterized protein n=1 Tax=Catharanthus roseus TaxID=4058 RepID=A0ACC0ACW2_CATRO|nr:hypothetical protein M9H77_26071 [Catharanthus roseus]